MSKRLDDLSDDFRPIVFELLARAIEDNVQVRIIDTLRTPEEQAVNIANGVSWTKNSKHLPDATGKANAIDIVPVIVMSLKNWAPDHPDWQKLGAIGEHLGLRWGGRWKQRDMGHFEYVGTIEA